MRRVIRFDWYARLTLTSPIEVEKTIYNHASKWLEISPISFHSALTLLLS